MATPSDFNQRQLDDSELESIVGGAHAPGNASQMNQLIGLIHDDLIGHYSGQDETGGIAAQIVSGHVTAAEVVSLIESGAKADGTHSVDQQLMNVQASLVAGKDAAAANVFATEEVNRLESGAAQANVGNLLNAGYLDVLTARSIVFGEAQSSGLQALGANLLAQETAQGGNANVEAQLGLLASVNAVNANTAIQTVEAAAAASGKSVDQALVNLGSDAGSKGFESSAMVSIADEETNRLQSGETAQDLMMRVQQGKLTDASAAALIASEGSQASVTNEGEGAVSAVLGLYVATGGQAAVQLELLNQVEKNLQTGAVGQLEQAVASGVISQSVAASLASEALSTATSSQLSGVSTDDLFTLESLTGGNATVELQLGTQLAGHLIDGTAEATIAGDIAAGTLTQTQALTILSDAIATGQQQMQQGAALGEAALGALDLALKNYENATTDTAQAVQNATSADTYLQAQYGAAVQFGDALAPVLGVLGEKAGAQALSAGEQLGGLADPTTGAEATIVANLMQDAQTAGVSVDAALTAANLASGGHSEVIKLEMTDRLMGGQAETDIANLVASGALTPATAVDVLAMAVGSLAAGSVNQAALGFDRPTAVALVLARLDLAAVAIQQVSYQPAAAQLQSYVEGNGGIQVAVGLGALIGLLQSDPTDNASAITAAQGLLNGLLPTAVAQTLVLSQTGNPSDDVLTQLTGAAQAEAQAVTNAFASAEQLVSLERSLANEVSGTQVPPPSSISEAVAADDNPFSASSPQTFLQALTSYGYTEAGVSVGASDSATYNLGGGIGVTLAAGADASASAQVGYTAISIQAAAQASASETIVLDSHTQIVELAQALADGAIVANPLQVTATGDASVGVSVTVTNTQQGSLGLSGLTGMETTTYEEQVAATAQGMASYGQDTGFHFNTFAGVTVSLQEQGAISFGGVTAGGGVTFSGGPQIGEEVGADINYKDGDINISGTIGLSGELWGIQFTGNLTLPTGTVVNALQSIGSNVGSQVASSAETAAQAVASEAQQAANAVENAANQAANAAQTAANTVQNAANTVIDSIGSLY